ncbi:MAG: hypothetical protein GY861_04900 [bacterium]|nr:hypothetical protein [bacterium]
MSSDGLDIGDRMKRYEKVSNWTLPRRIPVILRVDGRAFHTITRRRFKRAWSEEFLAQMTSTAHALMSEIQGCDFCYSQSDEISFLITDYKTIRTDAWFSYEINKMVSISASIAAARFSNIFGKEVQFDSRVFSLPLDEVVNYFIWRQIDATRNAIQFAGRENFHKHLEGVSCNEIQELLFQRGINFNDFKTVRKRGFCIIKNESDYEIPIFSKDRDYIERFVNVRED